MKKEIALLKRYLSREPAVELAFLFGSFARKKQMKESDIDIAAYLNDSRKESAVWQNTQRIVHREVDFVPLNNAPATLISNVFKTGLPLAIKNRKLYWDLYLTASLEAEDFEEFAREYWKIRQRAKSLSPEDRTRLLERLDFLRKELDELATIQKITAEEYEENKVKRRNMERWAENIINAFIDAAKIVLASEKKEMPKTYESALHSFALLSGLSPQEAERFSRCARLRNLLAHEYLDILYGKIKEFTQDLPAFYKKVSVFMKKYA